MQAWEIKKAVRKRYIEVCEEYGVDIIPFSWSTRMTRTHGMFKWRTDYDGKNHNFRIVLAERLSRTSLEAAMLTMLHEVSHYLDQVFNGSTSHGPSFHSINRSLGGSDKGRTQDGRSLQVADETNRRTVTYRCRHGNEIVRTRRIKTGGRYLRSCGCYLKDMDIIMG